MELSFYTGKDPMRIAQDMLASKICRHVWLSRNQKVFLGTVVTVNIHARTRNMIDKAIAQWKESSIASRPSNGLTQHMPYNQHWIRLSKCKWRGG